MLRHISEFVNAQKFPNLGISLGRHSYGCPRLLYGGEANVFFSVGSFCSFAENIKVFLGPFGDHPTSFPSTYPVGMLFPGQKVPSPHDRKGRRKWDVTIGSDVWIGRDVTILQGVTIGHGAVIGASSLVISDVPPYHIVGGVSAKSIRPRFDSDTVERLLQTPWWNLPDTFVRDNLPLFFSEDLNAFLAAVEAYSEDCQEIEP